MKLDFRSMIDAMGQVATGSFLGKAQGMQQAQQQNNQMFGQALNVIQMQDQERAREQQECLGHPRQERE